MNTKGQWDIFCKVIDNYGDVGVCWRLCCDLAARGQAVHLRIDDASALRWMAPAGCPGVEVSAWPQAGQALLDASKKSENFDFYVISETFGCEIDSNLIADCAINTSTIGIKSFLCINIEYITAEKYAERNHRLPSPVLAGPASGLTKHFFYPGFTSGTGGLLREPDLLERQARFAGAPLPSWLPGGYRRGSMHATSPAEASGRQEDRWISLFCYEPVGLGQLLEQLASGPTATHLLVTHGRAQQAVLAYVDAQWLANLGKDGLTATRDTEARFMWGALRIYFLPPLTQVQYDELLWACDVNFVRGEDSLVRALWAGKPFVWHIYPQDDGAHYAKLEAFLQFLGANDSLAAFHRAWNQPAADGSRQPALSLPPIALAAWHDIALRARERLLLQPDLTTQLMQFVKALSSIITP